MARRWQGAGRLSYCRCPVAKLTKRPRSKAAAAPDSKRRSKLRNTKQGLGIVLKVTIGLCIIALAVILPLLFKGVGHAWTFGLGFVAFLVISIVILTPIMTLLGLSADAIEEGAERISQRRIISSRQKHPVAGAISIASDGGDLSDVMENQTGATAEIEDNSWGR